MTFTYTPSHQWFLRPPLQVHSQPSPGLDWTAWGLYSAMLGAGSCPSLLGGASCDLHWHSWGTSTSPHCCVLRWPHPQWIFSWPVCSAIPGCGHLSRPQCPLADRRSSWGGPQAVTGPSWPVPCATGTLVGLGTLQSPFQKRRFVTVTTSESLHCFDCVPDLVNNPTG